MTARHPNPIPIEPPAAEKKRLARLPAEGVVAAHEAAMQKMSTAKTPSAASAASYDACYAIWEAERRGISLDRRHHNPLTPMTKSRLERYATPTANEASGGDRALVREMIQSTGLRERLPTQVSDVPVAEIEAALSARLPEGALNTKAGRNALEYAVALMYGRPGELPALFAQRQPTGCRCASLQSCDIAHDPNLCDCDLCVVGSIRHGHKNPWAVAVVNGERSDSPWMTGGGDYDSEKRWLDQLAARGGKAEYALFHYESPYGWMRERRSHEANRSVLPSCECGSEDAAWRDDQAGGATRVYMCDKCWRKRQRTGQSKTKRSKNPTKAATSKIVIKSWSY